MNSANSQASQRLSLLLTSYFESLNSSGLLYAVMRNYEGLPTTKTGNDIDILICPADARDHIQLLRDVAAAHDWVIIQVIWRPYICVVKLARVDPANTELPDILHIDFFRMASWYGTPFMDALEVLSRRASYGEKRIFILEDADEVLHLLLHHMLYTGKIEKEKYRLKIRRLLNSRESDLVDQLNSILGESQTNILLGAALSDIYLSKRAQRKIRAALILRRGLKNIYPDLSNWVKSFLLEAHSIFRPLGLLVGIISRSGRVSKQIISDLLPWLQRINRLNHGFVNSNLDSIILPKHQSSARRLRALYGVDAEKNIGFHSKSWFRRRLLLGRRRGWVICFAIDPSSCFIRKDLDLTIIIDPDRSPDLQSGMPNQVCLQRDLESGSHKTILSRLIVDSMSRKCIRDWNGS